ncbi:TlyA family RNA methyltransferase [Haliovirga abyssi]|uniref:TlyA family rRNA (Cytidine-2'-O)-methyltransferase n=1 Tax=Haliovirga abyssi TaxID=2996794 RepID=A0AAU9D1M4_9FUSO|nr:TlyA family RNA methyltransferase [Haliovirga abyssi]BDU49901.1 TlyA family rRNA (cytidine-2'-O)-methyltransferase [Haliovirga abyssi]
MKERLDVLLVEKGFFESREKAKRAIMAGIIVVNDKKVDKAGTKVKVESELRIKGTPLKYVGRGGLKLEKSIEAFELDFKDKLVLDIGASTGGFTDCALQNGARYVYSVDVGTNQLAWKLRQDSRVKSLENMHIKNLELKELDNNLVDYIVIDVSFISLTMVFNYLKKFLNDSGQVVALIKPQFEVGTANISKGGIVKDFSKHIMAIEKVINSAYENGLFIKKLDTSPITGTKGNVEYISLFDIENKNINIDIENIVEKGKKLKKGDGKK